MENRDKVHICHVSMDLINILKQCDDRYFIDTIIDSIYSGEADAIQELLLHYIGV